MLHIIYSDESQPFVAFRGGAPTMVAAKNANAAALREARTDYG